MFRGVPELLVVYFVYFGSSSLLTFGHALVGYEGFVGVPPFLAGALAVGVISGAYQAEFYRAAYLAIAKGELEAAAASAWTDADVPPHHRAASAALRPAGPRQSVAGGVKDCR